MSDFLTSSEEKCQSGSTCLPFRSRSRSSQSSRSSNRFKNSSSFGECQTAIEKLKSYEVKSRQSNAQRRKFIPPKLNKSASLLAVVRSFVGKDLSNASIPVPHSEPLTTLQRLTEDLEYSKLLDLAANSKSNVEEMAYVAAFSASVYCGTLHRDGRPFNPMLGETFECDRREDRGWRSLAEQVLLYPPTVALHCESPHWTMWMNTALITKYKGKHLEVSPLGTVHVEIKNTKRHYSWKKVKTLVHNLLLGKLWFEHSGTLNIVERNAGYKCDIIFKPDSFFSTYTRQMTGVIKDPDGQTVYHLSGNWDRHMEGRPAEPPHAKPVVLWQGEGGEQANAAAYNFSQLAIELNELEDNVAPTDSRLRPDVRLMELGEWDMAGLVKQKLEVNRGSSMKSALAKPLWFKDEKDEFTDEECFVFNGDYWNVKELGKWTMCPALFSV